APGAPLTVQVEALARSPLPVRLESVRVDVELAGGGRRGIATATGLPIALTEGTAVTPAIELAIPGDVAPSVMPWLRGDPLAGRDQTTGWARIAPWPEATLAATLTFTIDGERVEVRRAVRHVRADPVL